MTYRKRMHTLVADEADCLAINHSSRHCYKMPHAYVYMYQIIIIMNEESIIQLAAAR